MSQHLRNNSTLAIALAILSLLIGVTAQAQVTAVITADNAYGFGYGTNKEILAGQYYGGIENLTSVDITSANTGAEKYTVSPAITDYLYIVAWSDVFYHQGVLGQFKNGTLPPIYTGSGNWEVYATGVHINILPASVFPKGPSLFLINQQIEAANCYCGDKYASSWGWRKLNNNGFSLAIGETNASSAGNFAQVAGIDSAAKWMWFRSKPI